MPIQHNEIARPILQEWCINVILTSVQIESRLDNNTGRRMPLVEKRQPAFVLLSLNLSEKSCGSPKNRDGDSPATELKSRVKCAWSK